MTTTTVSLEDAGRHFDQLKIRHKEAVLRGLVSAANRGKNTIISQIIPSRSPEPTDRGIYRAGWKVEHDQNSATIFNPEVHAIFIEHGVQGQNIKIGFMMINALAEWVVRKGIATDVKKARSIAWAIATKMKQRGIFYGKSGSGGLGILKELRENFLPTFIQEEIVRELNKL